MSSAALIALQNAINTNTLTAAQQAALSDALALVIPSFPTPDELGDSIPVPEEALARDWMAALYTIQGEGGGGGPVAPTFAPVIFPTIAAMSAFDVSALPNITGQQAFVQSNGSVWTLDRTSALAVDGITIVAATGGGQWLRENVAGYVQEALLQTAWFVDAQNVTGTASDENDGLTAATAVRTKSEIYRRWGFTWLPVIDGIDVVITYLSTDIGSPFAGKDPGNFRPFLINGATMRHTAAFPAAAFTGTLLAVTPKSVAGNTALSSTFTPATGAIASSLILVNATRGNSRAVVVRDKGGGDWLLSQPLAPYVEGTLPTPTDVDTWANGDAISGFVPLGIDFGEVGGRNAAFDAAFSPGHIVERITIVDASATGAGTLQLNPAAYLLLVDTVFARNVVVSESNVAVVPSVVMGCDAQGQFSQTLSLQTQFSGGVIRGGGLLVGVALQNDTVITGSDAIHRNTTLSGPFYIDTGTTISEDDIQAISGARIYGPGTANVTGLFENLTGANFVTVLPVATLQLLGDASGYSNLTTGGLVATHKVALTAAALDAAAGGAGFGGLAYVAGASITNGAQP